MIETLISLNIEPREIKYLYIFVHFMKISWINFTSLKLQLMRFSRHRNPVIVFDFKLLCRKKIENTFEVLQVYDVSQKKIIIKVKKHSAC